MAAGNMRINDGFDIVSYEMGRLDAGGGGGGGDITVESKSFSSNGTYTAPAGKAYSPVTVHVQNSYAAGDEGKVVSNGELVAQGSDTATQNGTVDTTLINSLTVNVSGGGGGSSWTLLASDELEVSTSSTTGVDVGTVDYPINNLGPEDIIWVHIRDMAGKRTGYFYGCDTAIINYILANSADSAITTLGNLIFYGQSNGNYGGGATGYGVYAKKLTQKPDDHKIYIQARYSSAYGTINGTFKVDVYKLTPASGMTLFDT